MKFLVVLLSLLAVLSSVACAQAAQHVDMAPIYGRYQIKKVKKYRGGVMDKMSALSRVNEVVYLCPKFYSDGKVNFKNPIYVVNDEYNKPDSGVVGNRASSGFYGFMPDRRFTLRISVAPKDDIKQVVRRYELIDGKTFVELYDGYLFMEERIGDC